MSKNCTKCGKKLGLLEGKCTYGPDCACVCNECYKIAEEEHKNLVPEVKESLESEDKEQKDMLYRIAGGYSTIADKFKKK